MDNPIEKTIAILPLGATEQHGPHLPFETDTVIADGISRRLVERINGQASGRMKLELLPVEPVGYSPEHLDYAGSKSLDYHEAIERWVAIGQSLSARGIRKLVLLNAHGGNSPLMVVVATELRVRFDMLCVATSWTRFGDPDGLLAEGERAFGIHGGDIETSVMLALTPEKVAMEKAADFGSFQKQLVAENLYLHAYGRHAFGWKMQDLNPLGVTGNASVSTAEKGEMLIEHAIAGLVTLLEEVDRFDLSVFDEKPQVPAPR